VLNKVNIQGKYKYVSKILREEQIWKMLCHPLNIPDFVQENVVLKAEVNTPESVHEVLCTVCEHNNLKINSVQ